MRRERKRILNYTTYKRFIFSFLLVLFLPIIGFVYLFTQNFREIYYDNIIEQAEKSLEISGRDLGRNLENLESVVYYNSTNEQMSKAHIKREHSGEKVKLALATAMATNSMLQKVAYYNEVVPDMIYTENGTFSVHYYAKLYAGNKNSETLLRELNEVDTSSKWLLWENAQEDIKTEKGPLQYVVKSGTDAWWIFTISLGSLDKIIHTDDAVTVLLDQSESILYETGSIDTRKSYQICYKDPNNKFQLIRYIDREVLFADLERWQGLFFVVVIMVVLLGGVLIMILTLYNGQPFVEFLNYCRKRVKDVPENVDEVEIFYLALNELENQIYQEEKKYRINSLLLHMLYDKDDDIEAFKSEIKEAGIFENAIVFRVVLITGLGKEEADLQMFHLYLEALNKNEYYLIDVRPKNVMVMIVGMATEEEDNLAELTYIANTFYEETGEEIYFCVGGKCKDMSKIHTSYSQAIICSQKNVDNREEKVYYYKGEKNNKKQKNPENVRTSVDTCEYSDEIILKVQAFIEENSKSNELNVNMVANHFGISASLLSQRFKKQMNMNISDYINEKKFTYACELLKKTDYSVKEITELIGYSHPVSFIRKFKQLYGMTPIEYREK